ncbi:MAG TPA: site-specific DNA-methyltransferase [Thermoflexia bacterium]|nr:site-specific DNA-methyltransferase [Thermoflexia bacterium]
MTTKTAKLLDDLDWDFADTPMESGVHTIHPYPAKFIPQIPRQLIQLFPPKSNSVILDPFCGSGTTLVEAINTGLDTWGIDLNPLACLISRVKTTQLPQSLDFAAEATAQKARQCFTAGDVQIPSIPRLDHWFKPEVQQSLAALVTEIDREPTRAVREALQVTLSSIIVRVSNQESNTRYAAVENTYTAQDVFSQFKNAALTINRALLTLSDNLFRRLGHATVLNRDILAIKPEELPNNVGLVITSPPYPNAYEYWLYHKYRMYWLGMDPMEVREREIGARPHYFKKNAQDETDFEKQMHTCFQLLSQVMLPEAKACFLVGRSIIHGRVIDNATLLQRAAEPAGFIVKDVVTRNIPTTRKAFNPTHSKINREHLIIFGLQ